MNDELKIYAAPLQGFTEAPWRNAHSAVFGGVDAYYTPFVRLEGGKVRNKDARDVQADNNKVDSLIPQIIAGEPDEMHRLVDYLHSMGYRRVDLNMGCPFPLIANRKKGSGILPYPDRVKALLEVMGEYTDIDFSVKMRLGWESADEWKALLPMLNDAPLCEVTLHPRIGRQQYKGTVDREQFAAFCTECTRPLVYNGDLTTVEDIERLKEEFPMLRGVMLGRGLLATPSLAVDYRTCVPMAQQELFGKVYDMHRLMREHYERSIEGGDAQLLAKLKTMWEYLLPDMEKKSRKAIVKARNLQEYEEKVYLALHRW